MDETQLPATAPHEALATLVEIVPMPLAFFDRECRFVYANSAAAAQVKVPREELEGQSLAEVLPLAWPDLQLLFDRAFSGEIVSNLEVDLSEVSDEPHAWIGSFYPVREDGEVTAVAATSFDVGTLREVRRQLNVRNDLYAMLARVNAAASRSSSKEALFEEICEIAVETGHFKFAWIGMPKDGAIVPVASFGRDDRYLRALQSSELIISTDPEDERSLCQTGQAYLHGTTSFLNRYLESPNTKQWHEIARELGLRAAAALPILEQDQVVAVLTVYAGRTEFFDSELCQTLSEITESTSHALDRLELERQQEQVRQAQKLEAIGLLAGGVAHDFNNALAAIRVSVDLALENVESASVEDDLKQIGLVAEHAANLTRQLLAFSRQQVLQPQATDLNQVVKETTALVARVLGDHIAIIEELDPELDAVLVDRAQIQQVIVNLCINAREAMTDGGTITIRTSPADPTAGRLATLQVIDDGAGMDESTRTQVFEPFYTTKPAGTGLGLATVYGIVSQSGGQIEVESEPGVGTTFTIQLPTTDAAVDQTPAGSAAAPDSLDGTETILHVEDAESLRPLVARVLVQHGYTVLSAANAREALEIAKEQAGNIDLLMTDIVMPGIDGLELAERLLADHPHMRVLFTSGYSADMVMKDAIPGHEFSFIEKPFLVKELVPLVRSMLDAPSSAV